MIETTNPEIDVQQLMERVRKEAAKVHTRQNGIGFAQVGAPVSLASLPSTSSPPGLGLSGPVEIKKERLDAVLKQAKESTEGNRSIPKFLRSLFRRQGRYNRTLLEAVAALTKTNLQLSKRVQELQLSARQHHEWVRNQDAWTRVAAGHIASLTSRVTDLIAQGDRSGEHLRNLQRTADQLPVILEQNERAAEHLRNLQRTADQLPVILEQNERAAEHLRNLQVQVDRQGEYMQDVREQDERQNEHLRNLQAFANTTGEHLRNLQDETDRAAEQAKDVAPMRVTVARLDAEIQQLPHLRATLGRLDERQTNDAIYLKSRVSHHTLLLQQWLKSAAKKNGSASPALEPVPHASGELDDFYVLFEDRFRGARSEIKDRVRFYLPFLKAAKAGTTARPILDVGCGRGEWLELLDENGFRATGVDLNAAMVAQCAERNLTAIHADAIAHLRSLPANSHGGVSGFHIIEHLPLETLLQLFMETLRVLKPGGIAIFESPNCKNLSVGACYFNVDPTHRNPMFPETAAFMMETQGFADVQLDYLSPAERRLVNGDQDAEIVNDLLFGPQDFAVIARKPRSR